MSRTWIRPDTRSRRQIDLRDVAGDDHLGMEPEPGEKHLHLFRRGILRFIENDERIVQRSASHKSQRRNLNVAPLDQRDCSFHIHHVEQRIVERPEIGIHFGVHIAGQETEFLPCLNRRPRQE